MGSFRERALAASGAVAGMMGVPALCQVLDDLGPAGGVQCYSYLGLETLAKYVAAAVLGLALGAEMLHIVRPSAVRYRSGLLAIGAILGVVAGFAVAMFLATALRAMGLATARLSMAVVLTCTVLFAWSGASTLR